MLIGISFKTFKNGKNNNLFFNAIKNNLSKNHNIKWIDVEDIETNKKIYFDLIISFSYYDNTLNNYEEIKKQNTSWGNRYLTTNKLNYKNILYIESPICSDLIPGFFRINLNSIYFCENQLKDHISTKNFKLIKNKVDNFNIPKKRDYILFLLQNPLQYFINKSLKEYQIYVIDIIKKIREKTDKKIIVRYKPSRNYKFKIDCEKYNCIISDKKFTDDCKRCYKCIAHSTNAVSLCVFMEMDVIALSKHNLAYEVCEKDFENVDKYLNYDYTKLKTKILSCAYNRSDLKSSIFSNLVKELDN